VSCYKLRLAIDASAFQLPLMGLTGWLSRVEGEALVYPHPDALCMQQVVRTLTMAEAGGQR
jgi:hypothetical protein